jgi:glycine/D-amino acid oxidase-like deaminating enzyme
MPRTVVVGGGVFGIAAALELRARGDDVTVIEPGPLPHPQAESTDISKVIRADYGADVLYTSLMERALEGWDDWNGSFAKGLYHSCGVLFVTRATMTPTSKSRFEHESFALLTARGHALERLGGRSLAKRFPQWNGDVYADGYFNPLGGYAESGAVVSALARLARDRGVAIREGVRVIGERSTSARVTAVEIDSGDAVSGDRFVYTTGCWTGGLLADVAACFRATGHPVVHLLPEDADAYREERFPVFGADISQTGVYGFPLIGGVVKVASHGPGRVVNPSSEADRTVTAAEEGEIRGPLREALPALSRAPLAKTRICVYGDTLDGDLWIAPDPERPNRIIAAGGSGHGFKFAPVLGSLIADACEGIVEPRFRWRPEIRPSASADAARFNAS